MIEGFETWSELSKSDIVIACNLISPNDVQYIRRYFIEHKLEDEEIWLNYSYCLIACWWDAYSRWLDASYICVDDNSIENALNDFPIDEFKK